MKAFVRATFDPGELRRLERSMPVVHEDWRKTHKVYFSGEELAERIRDLGADVLVVTGSGRAAVFDSSGRLCARASQDWDYEIDPLPGDFIAGHRFDVEKFWATLCRATREALERAAVPPTAIAGVAATSQREGSVFLDAEGHELLATPNFDSRGFAEGVEVLERLGGPERLYRLTGHVPPFIFALSRLLWGGSASRTARSPRP